MNIPDKIDIQIQSNGKKDLSNLIIEMQVKAGNKNPYCIYFPKTDSMGWAQLSNDDFIGQFKDHWEMGLMDYNGTLESADPNVKISLFDSTWLRNNPKLALAWPLFKNEQKKWSSRKDQYSYMIANRNSEFNFKPTTINLHKTQKILLGAAEL